MNSYDFFEGKMVHMTQLSFANNLRNANNLQSAEFAI
ncbi:Uncharacterised protein [Mycobacteroides abscessus subsp. abscessus]|nr:Uncharacterised protein [Mycobacteroides abscessus subsp. abscessus]